MTTPRTDIGNAIRATLVSPNEADSNLEPANVVDGLFAIARALDRLAEAIARPAAQPRRLCDVTCPEDCRRCLAASPARPGQHQADDLSPWRKETH